MSTVIVYSKENCPFCVRAKNLLNAKGMYYTETVIGKDMIREDFVSIFPDVKTVPFILINNERVGGYEQLVEYFNNRPELLTERAE
jgi:glutaredoxin 3